MIAPQQNPRCEGQRFLCRRQKFLQPIPQIIHRMQSVPVCVFVVFPKISVIAHVKKDVGFCTVAIVQCHGFDLGHQLRKVPLIAVVFSIDGLIMATLQFAAMFPAWQTAATGVSYGHHNDLTGTFVLVSNAASGSHNSFNIARQRRTNCSAGRLPNGQRHKILIRRRNPRLIPCGVSHHTTQRHRKIGCADGKPTNVVGSFGCTG